jgi:hypothetical protein
MRLAAYFALRMRSSGFEFIAAYPMPGRRGLFDLERDPIPAERTRRRPAAILSKRTQEHVWRV